MNKPISTKLHGILDFATVGFALAFPRVLGCNRSFTNAVTMLALGKLGYALLTKHELGLAKVIPMKAHLAMDSVGGATLAALPFLTGEHSPAAMCCAIGMGAFDIAAAPMTETADVEEGGLASMASSAGSQASKAPERQWIPQVPSMSAGVPSSQASGNEPEQVGGRFGVSQSGTM
ncbi:MAG TPA: hypothetical protein VF796_08725 [Humisphaera sp.]